jgi:uncharacterized BrkB/YihY/UPF0761 family membrane protein
MDLAWELLKIVFGWVAIVFIAGLGLLVLWRIWQEKIQLNRLLEDEEGKASLSRFQFLIFTFVIGMSLFLVIVGADPPSFPEKIPGEIFALLGISGGSYLVSKGVQSNRDTRMKQLENERHAIDLAQGSSGRKKGKRS